MLKTVIIFSTALFLGACSTNETTESTTEAEVSIELKEIQEASEHLSDDSEQLNLKADSLLNSI